MKLKNVLKQMLKFKKLFLSVLLGLAIAVGIGVWTGMTAPAMSQDDGDVISAVCNEEDRYLPYPYDCKKFFQCFNQRPILLDCAPGTEWDNDLQVCNWPEAANCVAIPKPSESSVTEAEAKSLPSLNLTK